jgi:carbonic anhydrase/acetyltransferase-like protein (isoleucine patch superfamily)
VVGSNCIIGAGALVTKGTVVPDGSLFLGRPARLKRMLFLTEIEGNRENAAAYCKRREEYR